MSHSISPNILVPLTNSSCYTIDPN